MINDKVKLFWKNNPEARYNIGGKIISWWAEDENKQYVKDTVDYKERDRKKTATMLAKGIYPGNPNATSIEEDECYKYLVEAFPGIEIKRQYMSKEYPFRCDFMLALSDDNKKNIFIEYQGYEGHGTHPFDETNIDDLEKLQLWKDKITEKIAKGNPNTRYIDYVNIWTISDPNKRETAKKNGITLLEFFTINELRLWIENFKEKYYNSNYNN